MTTTLSTVTVKIRTSKRNVCEIEEIVGHSRIYRQGTDESLFAEVYGRERADLLVLRLNAIEGVAAAILERL